MRGPLSSAAVAAWALATTVSIAQPSNRLTVERALEMEGLGKRAEILGEQLIYEWIPPYLAAPNRSTIGDYDWSTLAQLYAVSLGSESPSAPAFTQRTDASYWVGGASPRRTRLAIFSLADNKVRIGSLNLADRRAIWFDFQPAYAEYVQQRPVWLSEDEFAITATVADESSAALRGVGVANRIQQLWQKTFNGEQVSASVFHSGLSERSSWEAFRSGSLVIANVTTGAARELADGYFIGLSVSPGRRHLAALKETQELQPKFDVEQRHGLDRDVRRHKLVVFDLPARRAHEVCTECNVLTGSLNWSADGTVLYFLARPFQQLPARSQLFAYDLKTKAVRLYDLADFRLACSDISVGRIRLVGRDNTILAYGHRRSNAVHSGALDCVKDVRNDWHRLTANGARNLTAPYLEVSADLLGSRDGSAFVLADRKIVRLGATGDTSEVYASSERISPWSVGNSRSFSRARDEITNGYVVPDQQTTMEADTAIVSINLQSLTVQRITKPQHDAQLLAVSTTGRAAVFVMPDRAMTRVMLVRIGESAQTLFTLNQSMSDVRPAREITLEYTVNDQRLSACLLLPHGKDFNGPFATVVHVYPDFSPAKCIRQTNEFGAMNLEFLASHGYAVLFPSTPHDVIADARGPARQINDVVMPAIDRSIQLGYTDAARLGLLGQSQGMHAALQMLIDTNRFKAAVVSHGTTNFASHYGQIALRYRGLLNDELGLGAFVRYEMAGSTQYIGATPWRDPERYIANSPIFFADRISTPVLIFHSDLDGFALAQSEELFSALYRLGKPAQYVTYWGEGHGNASPANIVDMWQRMFGWYDSYLSN